MFYGTHIECVASKVQWKLEFTSFYLDLRGQIIENSRGILIIQIIQPMTISTTKQSSPHPLDLPKKPLGMLTQAYIPPPLPPPKKKTPSLPSSF
jgi:hypothetical protein